MAAKEKLKTIATKVVEAFQQTEKYYTVLFSWYYKGFELSRRHFFKHHIRVDLGNLDLEEVDKEMVADKASQSTAPEGDALESAPASGDVAVDACTCYFCNLSLSLFLGARCILGLFNSNSRTIFLF